MRRNAVLAIASLVKLPKGDLLVPDADELIERFLAGEQDVSAKRNALALLTAHAQVRARRRGGDGRSWRRRQPAGGAGRVPACSCS